MARFAPLIVPRPVHLSYPGPVTTPPPIFPDIISWKQFDGALYNKGFIYLRQFIAARNPARRGALRLVPPIK